MASPTNGALLRLLMAVATTFCTSEGVDNPFFVGVLLPALLFVLVGGYGLLGGLRSIGFLCCWAHSVPGYAAVLVSRNHCFDPFH